jgi:hypothetical protein
MLSDRVEALDREATALPAAATAGADVDDDISGDALCLNPTLELWLGLLSPRGTGISPVSVPLRDAATCARVAAHIAASPGEVDAIEALRAAAPDLVDDLLAQHPGLATRTLAVRASCARRGRGRGQSWLGFDAVSKPVVHQILLWVSAESDDLVADEAIGIDELRDLLELGIVQFAAEASRRVPYCPELRVDRATAILPVATDVRVNDRITFGDDLTIAVTSPRYDVELELQVAPDLARQIRGLSDGQLAPAQLDPDLARALLTSHVLIAESAARDGEQQRAHDRDRLARLGYLVLPGLVPPTIAAPLRHYVRSLHREGYFMPRDPQVPDGRREIIHNEPVVRALHQRLAGIVSNMAGESLKPSYSVLAHYAPGAVLRRHVDRAQCAWNVSLAVDQSPEVDADQLWPLCFEVAGAVHEARLAPGDAAIYRGTGTPHWRPAQPDGHTSMFVFFHFVASDFTGSLD